MFYAVHNAAAKNVSATKKGRQNDLKCEAKPVACSMFVLSLHPWTLLRVDKRY